MRTIADVEPDLWGAYVEAEAEAHEKYVSLREAAHEKYKRKIDAVYDKRDAKEERKDQARWRRVSPTISTEFDVWAAVVEVVDSYGSDIQKASQAARAAGNFAEADALERSAHVIDVLHDKLMSSGIMDALVANRLGEETKP